GDVGNGPAADLVVGVPVESAGGAIHVLYGSPTGLTDNGNVFISQNSNGMPGGGVDGDAFGVSLAVGDFGNGPQDDIAIGVPLKQVVSDGEGAVEVVYGSPSGVTSVGNQ